MAKRKASRFLIYLALRTAAALIVLLPSRVAFALARQVARVLYRMIGRQRENALENLRRAYGEAISEAEMRALAKKVFQHMAQTAVEILYFPTLTWEEMAPLVDVGNAFEVYDSLFREGKGVIMLTAHVGNWELLGGVFCLKGYRGTALARRIYYEPYNRWIVGLRNAVSVRTLYRGESKDDILNVLAKNEILGLLPDQDVDSAKGVFVDFFGRPAYTMTAPVRIALATGAPLVPTFLIRAAGPRYRIVLGPVIRPVIRTTRAEAIQKYTEQWMQSVEKVIRDYPDQWMWVHNRWKTQPAASWPATQKAGLRQTTDGSVLWRTSSGARGGRKADPSPVMAGPLRGSP